MHKQIRNLYLVLVLFEVLSFTFRLNIDHFIKPWLMPVLIAYFITGVNRENNTYWYVVAALAMSWLGDLLLIFQDRKPIFFMAGLAAFLIAHLIYAFSYTKAKWESPVNPLLGSQKFRHASTLVFAGLALIYILLPSLGELKIPVIVYAAVLVIMNISALLRYGYTNMKSFGLIFGGAIAFMVSDSLLAINKFLEPIPYPGIWIMLTYCLAQWLIVEGMIGHKEQKTKTQ